MRKSAFEQGNVRGGGALLRRIDSRGSPLAAQRISDITADRKGTVRKPRILRSEIDLRQLA